MRCPVCFLLTWHGSLLQHATCKEKLSAVKKGCASPAWHAFMRRAAALCRLLIFRYEVPCGQTDVKPVQEVVQARHWLGTCTSLLHLVQRRHNLRLATAWFQRLYWGETVSVNWRQTCTEYYTEYL